MATDGLTHASSANPFGRSREAESATVIQLELPLKASAPPFLPAADQVVLRVVPSFPWVVLSRAVDPMPSSKPYMATAPPPAARGEDEVISASTTATTSAALTRSTVLTCMCIGTLP